MTKEVIYDTYVPLPEHFQQKHTTYKSLDEVMSVADYYRRICRAKPLKFKLRGHDAVLVVMDDRILVYRERKST